MKFFYKNKESILSTVVASVVAYIFIEIINIFIGTLKENSNSIIKILDYKISFEIKLYFIIIFIIIWFIFLKLFRKYRISKQGLKIISAKYYTNEKSIDITWELNKLVQNNKLKTFLNNSIAGDPHFHVIKKGKVIYEINGKEQTKEFNEGDLIDIP